METIENMTFDEERALYGSDGVTAVNCRFDGPADGESAFKECRNITARKCLFNLRYPFWHNKGLVIDGCELTENCRAAIWYTESAEIADTRLHGIKALRECADITLKNCDINSPEFGWSVRKVKMTDCAVKSEYFMMRSEHLTFGRVKLSGKYSFQYIKDAVFEDCEFDTKDAFWHAENVTVKNSIVKGEYLGWYSKDLTFENCKIIGTQPLCYCRGLKLINCGMIGTDLAFERSQVDAEITTKIISVKNPLSGRITAPAVGKIIRDIDGANGEVVISPVIGC